MSDKQGGKWPSLTINKILLIVVALTLCFAVGRSLGVFKFEKPGEFSYSQSPIVLGDGHVEHLSYIRACRLAYNRRLRKYTPLNDKQEKEKENIGNLNLSAEEEDIRLKALPPIIYNRIQMDRYRLCSGFFGTFSDAIGEESLFFRYQIKDTIHFIANKEKYGRALYTNTLNIGAIVIFVFAVWSVVGAIYNTEIQKRILLLVLASVTYLAIGFGWGEQYRSAARAALKLNALETVHEGRMVDAVSRFRSCLTTRAGAEVAEMPLPSKPPFPTSAELREGLAANGEAYEFCASRSRIYARYADTLKTYEAIMNEYADGATAGIEIPAISL